MSQTNHVDTPRSIKKHALELTARIGYSIFVLLIGTAIAYILREELITWLLDPLPGEPTNIQFLGPLEPLVFLIKVCFFIGFVLSIPLHCMNIWAFVRPPYGLRGFTQLLFIGIVIMLITGISFFYSYVMVLPAIFSFVDSITIPQITVNYSASAYLSFFISISLLMTANALLPVPIVLLMRADLITANQLRDKRKYVYPGILIMVAIISPTIDAVSLILLSAPAIIMFELGIIIGLIMTARSTQNTTIR